MTNEILTLREIGLGVIVLAIPAQLLGIAIYGWLTSRVRTVAPRAAVILFTAAGRSR